LLYLVIGIARRLFLKQISTNKLSQRKHVEIDGHYYVVRRKGSGDRLSINMYMTELDKLADKEKAGTQLTGEELDRITEIENGIVNIAVGCFDDGGDGSKSRELVLSLSEDELTELMETIFDEPKEPNVS
jgi:hypothetical protein